MVSLGSTGWSVEDNDFSFLLFHVSMDQHLSHPIRILENVACWRASFIHGGFYRTCFSSVSCSWKWLAMTRCFFSCSFLGGTQASDLCTLTSHQKPEVFQYPLIRNTSIVGSQISASPAVNHGSWRVLGFLRGWKIHRNPSGFHMISSTLTDMHGSPQSICH